MFTMIRQLGNIKGNTIQMYIDSKMITFGLDKNILLKRLNYELR